MKQKEFIEQLFHSKTKNIEDNTFIKTIVRSMKLLISDALSGDKFVNELLQNADDAGKICPEQLVAEFILTNNYLVFIHNGKPFTEADVTAISDINDSEREKLDDPDQTGNKGLGFKSVFTISDQVFIHSNGFSFRFDEHLPLWQKSPKGFPWQLTPIWTEASDMPQELQNFNVNLEQHIANNRVIFIFKIRNEAKVQEIKTSLEKFLQQTKNIIFLRNTKQIIFRDAISEKICLLERTIKETIEGKTKKNFIRNMLVTKQDNSLEEWYLLSAKVDIPNQLQKSLRADDNLAKKFQDATATRISWAVPVDDNQIKPVSFPRIYSQLPTDMDISFPFLVNAEFFLDNSRAYFQNKQIAILWHTFLLERTFYHQFQLANFLANRTNYWPFVVALLAIPKELQFGNLQERMQSFEKSFQEGKKKFRIIQNMQRTELVYLDSALIDKYQFLNEFGEGEFQRNCAHLSMKEPHKMVDLGATIFGLDKILAEISKPQFLQSLKDPKKNFKFITYLNYLFSRLSIEEKNYAISNLEKLEFILSIDNQLKKIEDIYFAQKSLKYVTKNFTFVSIVHALLERNEVTAKFLEGLKVKKLELSIVIKRLNAHPEQNIRFVRCILERDFSQKEYDELKKLHLKTILASLWGLGRSFVAADTCYLSRAYKPDTVLEDYLSTYPHLISPEYIEEAEDIEKLKKFFTAIGVKQQIDKSNLATLITIANKNAIEKQDANFIQLINFTKFLFNRFYYNAEDNSNNFESMKDIFRTLKIVATDGQLCDVTYCYLANLYQPTMRLEGRVTKLSYVSHAYASDINDAAETAAWGRFFAMLGAKAHIRVRALGQKYRNEIAGFDPVYISYLDSATHESDQLAGTALFPWNYTSYKHQHFITNYFSIEFIDEILETPVFWQVILANWSEIESSLPIRYHTRDTNRVIISNIEHFVIRLMQKKHNVSAGELYDPQVKTILGNDASDLKIAELPFALTEPQLKVFKFKTLLSLQDCVNVLQKIVQSPFNQEVLRKIVYIYESIYENLKTDPNKHLNSNSEILLLVQNGQYITSGKLSVFISEKIQLSEASPYLIRNIETFTPDAHYKIGKFFNLKIIKDEDLEVLYNSEIQDQRFKEEVASRLHYIGLLESHKQDLIGQQEIAEFLKPFVLESRKKLESLTCLMTDKLSVVYEDILKEDVDVWLKGHTLYYRDTTSFLIQKKIYEYIYKYLELNIGVENFLNLMSMSSFVDIEKKYKQCNFTIDNLSFSKQLVSNPIDIEEVISDVDNSQLSAKRIKLTSPQDLSHLQEATQLSQMDVDSQSAEEESSSESSQEKSTPTNFKFALTKFNPFSGKGYQKPVSSSSENNNNNSSQNNTDSQATPTPSQPNTYLSKSQMEKIGVTGEKCVFNFLQNHYIQKYGKEAVTSTDYGLLVKKLCYTKKLTWYNKDKETDFSTEDHDFKFEIKKIVNGQSIQKMRYGEVKATASPDDKIDANFSEREWKRMKEASTTPNNSYKLFCINNIFRNSEKKLRIVKNLNQEVEDGSINVKEMKQIRFTF